MRAGSFSASGDSLLLLIEGEAGDLEEAGEEGSYDNSGVIGGVPRESSGRLLSLIEE